MDCLFCKIVNKEIPAQIVFEDDRVIAFNDISPQAPHHVLVIPKKHIATTNEISDEDTALVGRMHQAAAEIAESLGFAKDGYRSVLNCNAHGGQTVYHIHLHLLGGKALGWPPYTEKLKQPL